MRKYYLDNIRFGTIILVVIYHVIYMFNGILTAGVIGPITTIRYQDGIQYLLYPWFMVILFLISGMCSRFYLEHHSGKEYFKARTRKLLVPSTIGLLVFGWIQGFLNMTISNALTPLTGQVPGIVMYLILAVTGTGVLWTIQVMWICSLILLLVRRIEKDRLYTLCSKVNLPILLLLVIPVWISAQILNMPVISVYRFGIYIFCFLLGYYVFSHDAVIGILEKYSMLLLIPAILLGITYLTCSWGTDYASTPGVNAPLAICYGWYACLTILGCGKKYWDKANAFTRYMAKSGFGLYVFHYTTLSAAAYALTWFTNTHPLLIYLLSAIAAFGGGLLLNEIISRIPIIRWCVLGMKKEKNNV